MIYGVLLPWRLHPVTLILSLANCDHTVLVSDRRLTHDGKLVDDESRLRCCPVKMPG